MDGNLGTFLFVFIGILVIAGWISSEMISSKATRASKKVNIRVAKLEKENDQLTATLTKEQERYKHVREEYEKAKEARDHLKEFELEYKKLIKSYNQFSSSITSLKALVSAKKYKNNSLSREIIEHLEHSCPNDAQLQVMKEESTKAAFKRIKARMKS